MTESQSPKTPENVKSGNKQTDGSQLKKLKLPVAPQGGSGNSRKIPLLLKPDKTPRTEASDAAKETVRTEETKEADKHAVEKGTKTVEEKIAKTTQHATDEGTETNEMMNTQADVNKPGVSTSPKPASEHPSDGKPAPEQSKFKANAQVSENKSAVKPPLPKPSLISSERAKVSSGNSSASPVSQVKQPLPPRPGISTDTNASSQLPKLEGTDRASSKPPAVPRFAVGASDGKPPFPTPAPLLKRQELSKSGENKALTRNPSSSASTPNNEVIKLPPLPKVNAGNGTSPRSESEISSEMLGTVPDATSPSKSSAKLATASAGNRATSSNKPTCTDEELEAVLNYSEETPATQFSNPQTTPDNSDTYEPLNYDVKSVDLEKGLGLPEELEDIINGYDDEIKHSQSRDTTREYTIHLAIARILEHAKYEKLAYVRYLKALETNGYSLTAIHELRRIARAYDKSRDVATLLQSELDIDIPKFEQAVYLEEYARIVQYLDETPDDAIRCLHGAVNLAPDHISPLAKLTQLLLSNQIWSDGCDNLNKLSALCEGKDSRACFYEMQADILNYRLKQPREAITKYLQTLDETPASLKAFNTVISLLMEIEHWQLVHKLNLQFAEATQDKTLTHSVLLMDGGFICDKLGDPQLANQELETAYNLNTTDPTALFLLLENFSQNAEHWKELDQILAHLEELSTTPKERSDYTCLRAVNLQANQPNESVMLEKILSDGYKAYPQNPFLQSMYLEMLMCTGQLERLEELSVRLMEENGADRAATHYTELGVYYKDKLRDYEHAIQCFKKALACNPYERRAFENAELIYRERADWESLISLYQRRLAIVQDARVRASLLFTLAGFNENIRHFNEAINCYNQYREIYPDDICAVHRLQINYRLTSNWLGLCKMLLVEKDMSPNPAERCTLYLRIAEICVAYLDKRQFAIDILQKAREENPQNASIYHLLCQILSKEKRWLEFVSVLNDVIRHLPSSNEKIATLCRIGTVYENQLSDDTSAISAYERILKLDPSNIFAIRRLEHIYQKTRNVNAFYALVLRTNPFITSPGARARRLYTVALKYISIHGDYNSAIDVLENALTIQNDFSDAGHLLNLCYLTTRRFDQLLPALHKASNYAKTQETKAECAFSLAAIYVWVLDQYADAVHPLELALALSPNASYARMMLILVQGWLHQHSECALLYMEAANSIEDKQLAINYYKNAADLAHYMQADPRSNGVDEISALKHVLEIDPNDIIANERLEAMEPSRANLVPFQEKRLLRATPDDEVELKLSIAESIFSNQPQRAFSLMCEVIEKKPFHLPALRMAANTALQLNNIMLAVRYLSMQGKCLENIGMRIIAWKEAAQLAQKRLNNPELAINNIKQAFLIAPQRMDLCDALVELLAQQRDLQEIDNVLQIHVRSISKANRVSRYLHMADFYINELKEPAQAVIKLRQVLEIDHNHIETYQKLIQVEIAQHHYHEAASAIESMLEIEDIPDEISMPALYELSALYVNKLHRSRQAIPILQKLLADKPEDIRALKLLSQVYFDEAKYQDSLAICIKLNKCLLPPENVATLVLMATIYNNLGDTNHIGETLKQAAEIVPTDPERVLNELHPWIQTCDELSVIRNFVETLVTLPNLKPDTQYLIYKFAANVYTKPLNMRFESDKYAVAAAQLMPQSLEAQLLAAHVFDPKEATRHAFEAAAIAPFNPAPYQALLDISLNAHRLDMQPRVEQQLAFLGDVNHITQSVQAAYASSRPSTFNSLNETVLKRIAPKQFNPYIHQLFKLAGPRLVPLQTDMVHYENLNTIPGLAPLVNDLSSLFGFDHFELRIAYGVPFVMGADPENLNAWCINGALLQHTSEAERRFHIACGFVAVSMGLTIFDSTSYEDISRLATNLIALVHEQYADPNVMAHIKQVLDRRTRRNIIDYVRNIDVTNFNFDPIQQCNALEVIESRAGLICCADLVTAINGLLRRKIPNCGPLDMPQQRILQTSKIPVAYNLMQYNLSDEFTDIRTDLGIALKINV